MNNLLDLLMTYGADVEGTMKRFLNDIELYETCLMSFCEDEGFARLKEALKAKDGKESFEQAHALKGVAGNLGLSPMFEVISLLVEALRKDDLTSASLYCDQVTKERETIKGFLAQNH